MYYLCVLAFLHIISGLNEDEGFMWGVLTGCIQALQMGFERTYIELDHEDVFQNIRYQEHIVLPPELDEVFRRFNSLHAIHYNRGVTDRKVTSIPLVMNRTAEYLARYGMEHMSVFAEVPDSFADLQSFLDRDMGVGLPFQVFEAFGLGDVID
ncbi:hypothetical protein DCAR_0312156 [Daucus carota subsp. sativus]|uniref:Uncharacterized protein n=1 Tax=Daucus carota subsp. sativus TaxID=79200 RepID=A0A166AUL5_DAUCS|nr:hypothetical protein DCAR_0312156 [Daucus carota subsp. sativus]